MPLLAAALLVPATMAHAEATVERFEFTTPVTDFQYSDGSYGVGGATERFAASGLNVASTLDALTSVSTFVHVDSITVYDANGQLIGTQTLRAVHHGTVRDLPPLGGPPGDEDVVRVEFEHARLTCDV